MGLIVDLDVAPSDSARLPRPWAGAAHPGVGCQVRCCLRKRSGGSGSTRSC